MENLSQPILTPPPQQPPVNKRKWFLIVLIFILVAVIYLFANGTLFKGALYLDDKLKERRLLSMSASLEEESELIKRINEEEQNNNFILDCDVVVAGAGTGGISASIASAREGAKTCLIEETDWLGGMLTAAGVSAIDGRPDSPSGIFYEIIQKVEQYYSSQGKQKEIHNCAVSYLCFEPSVGDFILKGMVKKEKNLEVFYNSKINKVYREGDKIVGVNFIQDGKSYIANADVTIDATEYGDLMYLGDIAYDLGVDPGSTEPLAELADQCIQPLTYVALLKKQAVPAIIEKPQSYNREAYKCTVKSPLCPNSNSIFDMNRLLTYGRMPNEKLMINTPSHSFGNDFHATTPNLENYSREDILEEAKNYSRGYIYFLQTELGMKNFALFDEFGTKDKFAKMPYVRESRRLKGIKRLTEFNIIKWGGNQRADLVKDAIAIGDYPIDLHFCRYGVGDVFKPISPYQIPYAVTIPIKVDGFLAADKNISVSHIVNGTTRLQPVTMSVGQAVGIAAAMASKQDIEPRNIDIKTLQEKLLDAGSNLFFFKDLPTQHWAYPYVSRLAINGLISGYGDFTFKPNNPVNESDLLKIFKVYLTLKNQDNEILKSVEIVDNSTVPVIRADVVDYLYKVLESSGKLPEKIVTPVKFNDLKSGTDTYEKVQMLASMGIVNNKNLNFRPNDKLTRSEAVVFLGKTMDAIFVNNGAVR